MTKIKVRDNGPYLIEGAEISFTDSAGEKIPVEGESFALCRCGASANKPFCDGAHSRIGFKTSRNSNS